MGSSQSRDPTQVSCVSYIAGRFFTAESQGKPQSKQRRESREFTATEPLHLALESPQEVANEKKDVKMTVDSRTHEKSRASTQSSADCLAFVTILSQPGSSLSQSP